MNRLFLLVPVAAALIGGCGGPPPTEPEAPAPICQAADDSTGTLVVDQAGVRPGRTAWYVRIETTAAKTVHESAYPTDDIALTTQLPTGQYRVIGWHRPCAEGCPPTGEQGLGPLGEVCGAKVSIKPGARVTATVRIGSNGTCSIRV